MAQVDLMLKGVDLLIIFSPNIRTVALTLQILLDALYIFLIKLGILIYNFVILQVAESINQVISTRMEDVWRSASLHRHPGSWSEFRVC